MRRAIRIAAFGWLLWAAVGIAQTTRYLGLPFEPKPVDCYDQAVWNGHGFTPTGLTLCLKD